MKILIATDGSESAKEATKAVRELGQDNVLDVTVLMVSYDPRNSTMQPWAPEWVEHENERAQEILSNAKRLLDPVCNKVSLVHAAGTTVPTILNHAKKVRADLIVVGAKGHSAIHRLLLGSVSDSVASRAQCSVLVVRPGDHQRFRHVLIGYDKSTASRETVAELLEYRMDRYIEVDVVSVAQQPFPYVGDGYVGPAVMLQPEQIESITEINERIASTIADQFPQTRSFVSVASHVGEAIVQAATEHQSDLVVVGDTGHSAVGELLLGSTSKYVLRHAPCSVWISRHHWKSANSPEMVHTSTIADNAD